MAPNVGNVSVELELTTRKASQQYRRFTQEVGRASRNANGLGSITQDARKFESALGAATNRVTAFAAAAVVFNTIQRSVAAFAQSVVDVDKALIQINVNLGQSGSGLKKFGAELFSIARQTGQTFEVAAKAAEELARQGLGAEETAKRLKDALILARIAGIDSADAVGSLTAAINSFNQSALDSTEIINKFVAVDTRFAVSSKDLSEAISRVGSTAQSAGVGINELVALVTSLQQTTARGGATIGNGLKTIFTRIQAAPQTLNALESLGISIKDSNGEMRSAIDVLRDYTKARERVGEAERAALDRTVAGTFQANLLKAAIGDLGREYSVYDSALRASNGATDEAIRKNEELNKTLSSLINSTAVSLKQLFANVGDRSLSPLLNDLLTTFEKARAFLSGDTGSKMGEALGNGILSGITNVLTGPVFVGIAAILGKAFFKIAQTIKQEAQSLISLNNTAAARAKIQERINFLLASATQAENAQYRAASSVLAQKQAILAIQQRIAAMEVAGTPLVNSLITRGALGTPSAKTLAVGHIPKFADPVASAIARESHASGLPTSQIYIGRDSRVANFANPAGLLVANRRDEPSGAFQGVNRVLAMGGNPKTNGIPNFAPPYTRQDLRSASGQYVSQSQVGSINALIGSLKGLEKVRMRPIANEIYQLTSTLNDSSRKLVNARVAAVFSAATRREGRFVTDRNRVAKPGTLATALEDNNTRAANIRARKEGGSLFAMGAMSGVRSYNESLARRNPLSLIDPSISDEIQQEEIDARFARSQSMRNKKRAAIVQRRQSLSNKALYGGIALSFAGGFIPEGKGGTGGGITGGLLQGATQGAGIGGIFGVPGLAAGAGIGALIGAFSKLQKSTQELAAEFDETRAMETKRANDLANFVQGQDEYDTALSEGNTDTARKIAQRQTKLLAGADKETLSLISGAGGSSSALKEALQGLSDKNNLNELKRQGALGVSSIGGLSVFGASQSKIEGFAKILSQLASETGKGIGEVKFKTSTRREAGGGSIVETKADIDSVRQIFKELGIETSITATTINDDLLKGLKLAREEFLKTGEVSFKTGQDLKKFQQNAITFASMMRSASTRQEISGIMTAGRTQRRRLTSQYQSEGLAPFATTNQSIDLQSRQEAIRAVGESDLERASAEGKFRQDLQKELKSVFSSLSKEKQGKVFNDRTPIEELRQMALSELPMNDDLNKSIQEYQGSLEKNRVALEENLKTLELENKRRKEVTEILRAQKAFSSGSLTQASEGSRGLSAFYRPARDKRDTLLQDDSFVRFVSEMQGMDADVSALTPLANKATARTNKERFLIEAEGQIQSLLGPRNLKDYSGNVRQSGVEYAAKELSRYQDPYKKSVGNFILDNLKAQEENAARAGSAQSRIKDVLGSSISSPEELAKTQLEAATKLQEALNGFTQKTINVTLDVTAQVKTMSDGLESMDTGGFKKELENVVRGLVTDVMALKGKPVPPTVQQPSQSTKDFNAFYGIPNP